MTNAEAVSRATAAFNAVTVCVLGDTIEQATERLFDASSAVVKLLAPFVTSAVAEEDSGYDIEPDDL